jgi:hypothetical protein
MRWTMWPVLGLVGALSITGCDDDKSKSSDKDDDDASSEREDKAKEPVLTTEVLEQFDDKIEVSFALPAGWEKDSSRTFQTVYKPKKTDGFRYPTVELKADCNGMCDPRMIPDNIVEAIDEFKKHGIAVRTGDPEIDGIEAELEILEDRELESGKLIAMRISYSDEAGETFPFPETIEVRCYIHPEGQTFYIGVSGSASLEEEESVLEPMIAMCESIEIKVIEAPAEDQ